MPSGGSHPGACRKPLLPENDQHTPLGAPKFLARRTWRALGGGGAGREACEDGEEHSHGSSPRAGLLSISVVPVTPSLTVRAVCGCTVVAVVAANRCEIPPTILI